MSPELKLKINGKGVRPETVHLSDLIDLLKGLNSAFNFRPKGSPHEQLIALTQIREGSDELVFETDQVTHVFAHTVITALSSGDLTNIPLSSAAPLRDLWRKSSARAWTLEVTTKNNGLSASAVISPENELFASQALRGKTSLVTRVIRVGGESDPTARLRLPNGESLTAHIATQELSQALAAHLYRWVQVQGEAQWTGDSPVLDSFRVTDIGPYAERDSDPVQSLNDLAVASGGFWDKIDPAQYVRDLRSND